MSEIEVNSLNHQPNLTEAFRRVHFLDHVFPVLFDDVLNRAQTFELSVIASGVDGSVVEKDRIEGLMQSIDDYNDYLDGGVLVLTFDESFITHVSERIHQARLMAAQTN